MTPEERKALIAKLSKYTVLKPEELTDDELLLQAKREVEKKLGFSIDHIKIDSPESSEK